MSAKKDLTKCFQTEQFVGQSQVNITSRIPNKNYESTVNIDNTYLTKYFFLNYEFILQFQVDDIDKNSKQ